MADSTVPRLKIERGDGVAVVTLNRPEKLNALDDRLLVEELPQAWADLADDDSVAVVVVTGEGSAFCAGADLDGCSGFRRGGIVDTEEFTLQTLRPVVAQKALPQLTIAAVHGPAVGAGFGLAAACDMRFVGPQAVFKSPFITMGLVPDYGLSWTLPRLVGTDHALDVLLTGRSVDGQEAADLGLATRFVEDPAAQALAYAQRIAAGPARAQRITKQAVYAASDQAFEEAVLVGEGRSQSIALKGEEFAQRFAAWHDSITRSSQS